MSKTTTAIASALTAATVLFVIVFSLVWTTCRVYVPEGYMAVVTTKTGKPLPSGQILAEPGQKGVQRDVLTEGRHFLNPINNDWVFVPATTIKVGDVGVVTSKVGKELPPGDILAPDELSKGVWRQVLGPGTYRLNPQGYDIHVLSAINIPIGYVGIVTSLTGVPATEGAFAAPGQKGVREQALQPGLYYINPRAYQVNLVEVGMNQVSILGRAGSVVVTKSQISNASAALDALQQSALDRQQALRNEWFERNNDTGILGKEEAALNFAPSSADPSRSRPAGRAGAKAKANAGAKAPASRKAAQEVAEAAAPPAASPVPSSDNVAFGMNQFVQFPSSDGFQILLDMTVEFELMPADISRIYMLYGDLPAVVGKIILPQILSVSRIKGSGYKAREFIDGEGRQKFQEELTKELVEVLGEKHILVRNAIVSHVEVPEDILAPIQAASEAKEQDLTNQTRQETAKKQAQLNTEVAMVAQLRRQVEQETRKLVATIAAETKQAVASTNALTDLRVAEIGLERARIEAKTTQVRGEAEVQADFLVANEEALGEQRKAKVFENSATLADLVFADSLSTNVSVRVIHAGEGTFWTDLKGAQIAVPAR